MAGYIQARGFTANNTSVWRDYRRLGYKPNKAAGRRKKTPVLSFSLDRQRQKVFHPTAAT